MKLIGEKALTGAERQRRYKARNPLKVQASAMKYLANNADVNRINKREFMRKNRVKATYWKKSYKERFGSVCEICGESRAFDICHIIPVNQNGETVEWNILILCPTHHRLFDQRKLSDTEYNKVADKVLIAKDQFSNKVCGR
jgi:predicted restriction endonuclease